VSVVHPIVGLPASRDQGSQAPCGRQGEHIGTLEELKDSGIMVRTGERRGQEGAGMKFTFKIKHLMYLTLWTALIMAGREPLLYAVPDLVKLIVWLSGAGLVGIFVGLYGIALMMPDCSYKYRLFNRLCYVLIGDGILFFLFVAMSPHVVRR
jgi:hypothetical protein